VSLKRKTQVTTSISLEDYEKLAELSRETGKSISALIREMVEEKLREKEAKA